MSVLQNANGQHHKLSLAEKITIEFISWLRNEIKFPGVEALTEQLHADKKNAQKELILHV